MDELKPRAANSTPLTPLRLLERAAVVYPDSTSIVYNTTTYTWSQTHRRCLQLASSISSLSINPGDVVSVVSPNIPAIYELHFAVPMSGAILNTINTRLDARTISVLLRHGESKMVFVDFLLKDLILEAFSMFPPENKIPVLVVINTDNDDHDRSTTDEIDYEELVTKGDAGYNWVQPDSDWTPMVLNYTSASQKLGSPPCGYGRVSSLRRNSSHAE